MPKPKSGWQKVSIPFDTRIGDALAQAHHAATFIGMFGYSFAEPQSDDSHTTLQWSLDDQILTGRIIRDLHPVLNYNDWRWELRRASKQVINSLPITGNTMKGAFRWFKERLGEQGFMAEQYRRFEHFSIPHHPLDEGQPFGEPLDVVRAELVAYRNNAQLVVQEASAAYSNADPVRIWPHHFDTGTMIVLASDEAGKPSKTLGLGWAIPDRQISEPYFYINHWVKDQELTYTQLPQFTSIGKWHHGSWTGAVLPLSDLHSLHKAEDQRSAVTSFFKEGIRYTFELMG